MRLVIIAFAMLVPSVASAQASASPESAAARDAVGRYPTGVSVRARDDGFYYADARGMTLYALDQRIASGRTGTPNYCVGPCQKVWTPFAAAVDAKSVGDWTIVTIGNGPQWAFKRKPVFLYIADHAPGDMAGDKYEDLWAVMEHVPPQPKVIAPATVAPLYIKGRYVLSDLAGHVLFTATKSCAAACAPRTPFAAGMAAREVGQWTVLRSADLQQWSYRGEPVFLSTQEAPTVLPAGGTAIQP